MIKNARILLLLIFLACALFSQDIQTGESSGKDIYASAFSKAFKDGKITKDERAVLQTLQESLNLSDEEINRIENEIRSKYSPRFDKELDTSGKWIVYTQNIFYASTYYGWGIPYLFDAQNIKWYVGSEMLSIPAGFAFTYFSTRGKEYPYSRAFLHLYGSLLGDAAMDALYSNLSHKSLKKRLGLKMAFIPAGIYATDRLYRTFNPSTGQALVIMMFGASASYGFYDLYTFANRPPHTENYFFVEESSEEKYKRWEAGASIFRFLGHPFGIWLERKYFGSRNYSSGDAILLYTGNRIGIYYTLLLDMFINNGKSNSFRINMIPARLAGMCLGTLYMDRFVEDKDYSFGQSVILVLGGLAGDAFLLGTGILLELKGARVSALFQFIGSAAGFYITSKLVKPSPDSALVNRKSGITVIPSFIQEKRGVKPSITINWTF